MKSQREKPSEKFKMMTQPGQCTFCDIGLRNIQPASGTKVCLLALDTSDKYTKKLKFDDWYLMKGWFESLTTLGSGFDYVFYLGYPHLHSFYCNCTFTDRLHALYSSLSLSYALLPIYGSENSDVRTLMWNSLARRAFLDGCEYFILSDIQYTFSSSEWIHQGIEALDSTNHCSVGRKIGVVEFPKISIVHKIHLELHFLNFFSLWGAFNGQLEWLHHLYDLIDCTTQLQSNALIPGDPTPQFERILTLPCTHSLQADVLTSYRELRMSLEIAGYGKPPAMDSVQALEDRVHPAQLSQALELCKKKKESQTHEICEIHWDPFKNVKKKKKAR